HSSPTATTIHDCLICCSRHQRPPRTTLFPYTTLFRSAKGQRAMTRASTSRYSQSRPDSAAMALPRVSHLGESLKRSAASAKRNLDRKSTRLNSSHGSISYAVFCLKKKKNRKKKQ